MLELAPETRQEGGRVPGRPAHRGPRRRSAWLCSTTTRGAWRRPKPSTTSVLALDPQSIDALHFLGVIAHQQGMARAGRGA